MRYASGQMMSVGDEVIADGKTGVIVCDFDNGRFAANYGLWNYPKVAMLGGGAASAGVMVETANEGLIYYQPRTGAIELVRPCEA